MSNLKNNRTGAVVLLAALLLPVLPMAGGPGVALARAPAGQVDMPYRVDWNVQVPMRDGVRLNAMVYRPANQDRPLPVIMSITPYDADRFHDVGVYFAKHGYVFASLDSRGRYESEGTFVPWVREAVDGYDAVEWLAAQPWSDGQVASWGGSYGGKDQWSWASMKPPHLKTIVPASPGMVGYDVGLRRNIQQPWYWLSCFNYYYSRTGIKNFGADKEYWDAVLSRVSRGEVALRDLGQAAGMPGTMWQEWVDHPVFDAYWQPAGVDPQRWKDIQLPVLTITGLYDASQLGSIEFRRLHRQAVAPEVAARSYLVMGPWQHSGTRVPERRVGGLDFGEESLLDIKALHVAWFDWIMKGGKKPEFLADKFVYYLTGSNRWLHAADLDQVGSRMETLYLASPGTDADAVARAGQLLAGPAADDLDRYVDDPAVPGRKNGAYQAAGPDWLTDASVSESIDGDGLVYETAALVEARDLVGRPEASLEIAIDTPDVDVHVQLYEVRKDGSVVFLSDDMLRARYRDGGNTARPVRSGRFETYRFDQFRFIARTLAAGSRIRMLVTPMGRSILEQRNRNSGGEVQRETAKDQRVAQVQVRLGKDASRLRLPFL